MTNSHGAVARLKTILGSRNGIEIISEILTKQENNEGNGKDLFQAS